GLVGSGQTSTLRSRGAPAIAFPEAGQTIAGFRLVEELGRGAFARVFRAEERQLADRPVALKVARAGSREPQTLARLQHTHIVPVYSYRTDPVTGLHLLCMPYLGRVTLAQVLADEAIRSAGSGADLIAMLDRLQPLEAAPSARPVGKAELRRRSYPRAVAWWAARLAEALQHAHDRGVMHRDVKPSNVLITADATPMLLDFNLAQERWIDDLDVAPAVLGGTLAYMAPEHLDALAEGVPDRVAGRSDLFALGVVVFEMLARGVRPFANPSGAATVAEALRRAADERRGDVPRLRAAHPEVSSALEAVVRRCLAPDPTDRYTSAADLAADLQAVADDRPPRFAREPLASRSVRWLRHNRRRLALAALMSLALTILAGNLVNARLARFRLEADVKLWISEGEHAIREDHPEVAAQQFATAAQLAASDPGLRGLRDRASRLSDHARRIKAVRDKADELFRRDEPLRFRLFGDLGDPKIAREIKAALRLFDVPDNPRWARQPDLALLDEGRRTRLLDEINQMLFLWVVSLDGVRPEDPGRARQALAICDAAEGSTAPIGPWRALHERYRAPLDGKPSPRAVDLPARETSARACFQWGMLRHMEDRDDAAIAWLERAVQLKPDDYWSQFCLAFLHYRARHVQEALDHYNQAVVLRPEVPWARFNRALLHHERGDWEKELDDLDRALATARDVHSDYPQARLGLGLLLQYLGDVDGARKAYDAVIASGSPLARAARFNRAKLDFDTGQIDHAQAELDALVAEAPIDPAPRLARALLALRLGAADRAESDLTYLLRNDPRGRPERLAHRAQARLALGRPAEAEEDAEASLRLEWTPGRERLWIRTLLALRRGRDLVVFDRPEDVALMPAGGPALRADLRAAAEQLRGIPGDVDPLAHRACAVLQSALDDPTAEIEASRAVALLPGSADAYLIRARVRRRRGDRHGALEDVDRG
ncbi:MAG: protein kinase, partial [Planctomycetaceae bacterium]|nr:protein kinase [Planctomycetaceae bacterium]